MTTKNNKPNIKRYLTTEKRYNDFVLMCNLALKSRCLPQACRAAYYAVYTLADHYFLRVLGRDLGRHTTTLKLLDSYIPMYKGNSLNNEDNTVCLIANVRKCADYDFLIGELGYDIIFDTSDVENNILLKNFFTIIQFYTENLIRKTNLINLQPLIVDISSYIDVINREKDMNVTTSLYTRQLKIQNQATTALKGIYD